MLKIRIDPRSHYVLEILNDLKNGFLGGKSSLNPVLCKTHLRSIWIKKIKSLSEREQNKGIELMLFGAELGLTNKGIIFLNVFDRLCKKLEDAGYIQIETDGKYRYFSITKEGERLFKEDGKATKKKK